MNYSGEQDYANKEWKHYKREAKAAVTECCRAKIIEGAMLCPKCGYTARAMAEEPVKECADSFHASATCKENPSDIIDNVKMAIGKALIPDGVWNIDEGRKLERAAKAAIACMPKREIVKEPTEAMCRRARGFIMGLDLGYRTWKEMDAHLTRGGYPTLWSISDRAKIDSQGHITKWDVAQCIYLLMNSNDIEDAAP